MRRNPDNEIRPGYSVGGPVLHNRLFFSSAYEHFRSRSLQAPVSYLFPSQAIYGFAIAGRSSRQLLQQYLPFNLPGPGLTAKVSIAQPVEVDQSLAIERLDYISPSGKDRIMARGILVQMYEPDFIWTPYPDFISHLSHDTPAIGGSYIGTIRPNVTNEARASFSNDDLHWNRPHPEIPTLASGDGTILPGSPAFYAYKNVNRSWELLDNVIWTRGKHLTTFGAGVLLRNSNGYLTAGADALYSFSNIVTFALDQPNQLQVSIDRNSLPNLVIPDFNRTYSYQQYFVFAQDTYKIARRLTLNYGLRYEIFGGPSNVGATKDDLVQMPPGNNLAQQLTSATLTAPPAGDEKLFGTDKGDVSVRVGAACDLFGTGNTIIRGGFGTFYDRPFDNLWENVRSNDFLLPFIQIKASSTKFLTPIATILPTFAGTFSPTNNNFPDLTLVNPNLQNAYSDSYFAGVQQRVTGNLTVEVNGLGAYGRRLITTDVINRPFSTLNGSYNPNLNDISYRANQGHSDYNALTAVVRYRASRGFIQASYTWSHSEDNQSDPLIGDFFNLSFTQIQSASGTGGRSAFSQQFNARADWGNSDFDQRQNLVIFSYWNLPQPFSGSKFGVLFRNWTVAELAAFRSGFPYSVIGTSDAVNGQGQILNDRANIVNPNQAVLANPIPVAGGVQLLNPAAFSEPGVSILGNGGRNAFIGPGFYSVDVSLARSFGVKWLGEGGRITFRADAFNFLNHANLNNPDSLFTNPPSPTFGIATFGRLGAASGFPAVSPLNETARQIELLVRVQF